MASLCAGFENVSSFHEPVPALCGPPMIAYQLGNPRAMEEGVELKWQKIKKALEEKPIYFESNHYFIKGFGWEMIKKLQREEISVGILILKRNPQKIVDSFFRIGTSIIGKGAEHHLIHPESKMVNKPFFQHGFWSKWKLWGLRVMTVLHNVPFYLGIQKRKSFALFADYQKKYLYWYLEQFENLKQKWMFQFPNLKYVEIHIEEDRQNIIKVMEKEFGMKNYTEHPLEHNRGDDYVKQR